MNVIFRKTASRTSSFTFYRKVRTDEQLGPIFNRAISELDPHLATMYRFWSSVMYPAGNTRTIRSRPMSGWTACSRIAVPDTGKLETVQPDPATSCLARRRRTPFRERPPGSPSLKPCSTARTVRSAGCIMTFVVTDNCIKCKWTAWKSVRSTASTRREHAGHPSGQRCIDCGVCRPECPAEAIVPDTGPEPRKLAEAS